MIPKVTSKWYSHRVQKEILTARWGRAGQPVLLYPTAGGDAEECERFLMMKVLAPLLEDGKIRIYSVDSAAGRLWTDGETDGVHRAWFQNRFDDYVVHELVPAIRKDCGDPGAEIITAGASLGAFNALASVCRHPDLFKLALCLSGTFDFTRWMTGEHTLDFHYASPMHFLPTIEEGPQLAKLRTRFVLLATGTGDYEAPWESKAMGKLLGSRGIPNRVDLWEDYRHDWMTWRDMLPQYLTKYVNEGKV